MSTDATSDVEQRAARDWVRDLWNRPDGPNSRSLKSFGPGASPRDQGICTQHGLVVLNRPRQCRECSEIRARAGGGVRAARRWAAEVGVPPDASLVVLIDPEPLLVGLHGDDLQGYRTESIGAVVSGPHERPNGMPLWFSPLGSVLVWAKRAVHEATGVVSEVRWHPDRTPRPVVVGRDIATYAADMQIARRGFDVLDEVIEADEEGAPGGRQDADTGSEQPDVGRPEGSGKWPRDRFRVLVPQRYQEWLNDNIGEPTQEEFAAYMKIPCETFRWMRRKNYECMSYHRFKSYVVAELAALARSQ